MRLPGAERCIVTESKVRDYLLNGRHPIGASKAQFFNAFGFLAADWAVLGHALCDHPRSNDIVSETWNGYGTIHVVECAVISPDGRNPCIRTVWITEDGQPPKLVTAYPR